MSVGEWTEFCRASERLDYDVLLAPDHLGAPSPLPMFDGAGISWRPHTERAERLERSIRALDRLFAEDGRQPLPQQVPRPRC